MDDKLFNMGINEAVSLTEKHLLYALDQITCALKAEKSVTDMPQLNIGPIIASWASMLEVGIWPPDDFEAAQKQRLQY